jgi:flagellar basal-body rod modification protein FlgD
MPAIQALTPAGGQAPASPLGQFDGEAFLKLLVAQLRFQNPMAPSDPTAMLQQTAQFSQVETLQRVAASQQQLLGLAHATVASGMIGKEVTAETSAGTVSGVVDGIRFSSLGPVLLIGETEVPLAAATQIRDTSG